MMPWLDTWLLQAILIGKWRWCFGSPGANVYSELWPNCSYNVWVATPLFLQYLVTWVNGYNLIQKKKKLVNFYGRFLSQYCWVLPLWDMTTLWGRELSKKVWLFVVITAFNLPFFHYYNFLAIDVNVYLCWLLILPIGISWFINHLHKSLYIKPHWLTLEFCRSLW